MAVQPLVFWSQATEHRAIVYVRCDSSTATEHQRAANSVLQGQITGPYRADGGTLASRTVLQHLGNDPCPLARATIVDPCCWEPDAPVTYQLQLRQSAPGGEEERWTLEFGLRQCRAEGSSVFWGHKRWVFRGLCCPAIDAELWNVCRDTRGGVVTRAEPATLQEATRRGVPVALLAAADAADNWTTAAACPAVWTVVFPVDIGASAREQQRSLAPNTLLSVRGLAVDQVCPPWADVQWRRLEDLNQAEPSRWGPQPVIVVGGRHAAASAAQSRQQVDYVQAKAAAGGVFAGFVCCDSAWRNEDLPDA